MNSSTRITIYGQTHTYRGAGIAVSIDRNFPGILMGQMNASDWIQFCQKIDKALVPLSRTKLRIWRWIGRCLAIVLAFGVLNLTIMEGSYKIAAFLILVPLVYYCACYKMNIDVMENLRRKIGKVCGKENEKRSTVSFELKEEKHYTTCRKWTTLYIECNVNTVNPNLVETGLAGHVVSDAVPIATAVIATPVFATAEAGWVPKRQVQDTTTSRSTAQRLQDLDRMKAALTEEEYNNCQKLISSGITTSSREDVVSRMEDLELNKAMMTENEYMDEKTKILSEV